MLSMSESRAGYKRFWPYPITEVLPAPGTWRAIQPAPDGNVLHSSRWSNERRFWMRTKMPWNPVIPLHAVVFLAL